MANFARVDENWYVIDVQRVHDDYEKDGEWFLSEHLGLGGKWIQTSFSGAFRGRYAGIGYWYDKDNDVFIAPKPFPSWVLNPITWEWEAPIPRPDNGKLVYWSEDVGNWVEP